MEDPPRIESEWFRLSFDALYPLLYRHRDLREADDFVACLLERHPLGEGRILDLGCGPGRHLEALENHGTHAVGLDLSAALLESARRRLARPMIVRGDMRDLPYRGAVFGWVLVMFTTFGYFPSEEQNHRVLSEIARVLQPSGWLVLDLHNAREARRRLIPLSRRTVDGLSVEERRWIEDGRFLRKTTAVQDAGGGEARSYDERVRLYEEPVIATMLEHHGFEIVERWGGYDAVVFEAERSRRLLVFARRGSNRR
jgi:SAM-dependent methyltransferase